MRTASALVILSLLLLYVWERMDVVRVGYRIEQLKTKKAALERDRDELQVKVSKLMAPERIAKAATEKLGMIAPQPGQVRLVRLEPAPTKEIRSASELKLAKTDALRSIP
jgi:cell division protein FtsL